LIFVDRSQRAEISQRARAVLLEADKTGLSERQKAIRFYEKQVNRTKSFAFRRYKEKAVTEALNELFHGKCAYCESIAIATQPIDVEHFRPKAGYNVTLNGRTVLNKPSYYWLAADWDNLLPSCIDCNRERIQTLPDGISSKKSGKGNNFPLEDETMRAAAPGDEAREVPLLLNPCVDLPEEHLEFMQDGNVRAKLVAPGQESHKGQVSIEIYGLRRLGLLLQRQARAKLILAQITRVEQLARAVQMQGPFPIDIKSQLREEIKILRGYMSDDQPYAGMARQMINAFIESARKG